MNSFFKLTLAALAAFAAAGCTTDRSFGTDAGIEITDLDSLPEPTGQPFYAIGAQETLEITVVGAERLTGQYLTDENGQVSFPLLGLVDLKGKSPNAAARLISNGLNGRFIIDPQVRVIPTNIPGPTISVGGQVNQPGSYPALGRPTLARMINEAEGLTEFAEFEDVLVIRNVNGQRYIGIYNIRAIQRGNYPDPELFANDIVTVGDSPERRRLETILQFLPLLSTAAIVIDRVGR